MSKKEYETFLFTFELEFYFINKSTKLQKFEKLDIDHAWNPDLAIPLAYSNFGVYDILARSDSSDLIVSNPNTGALSLVYSSNIASLNADALFGNFSFDENYSYSALDLSITPQVNFSGQANSFNTEVIQFQTVNGEELHHVFFKNGFFNIHLETDVKHDVNVTMTFPELKSGNTPIVRNELMEYSGSSPTVLDFQIDLTDLTGDFTMNNTTFNQLEVEIQTTVIGNGNQDITGGEFFNSNISSQNMNFHNIDGYFGQSSLLQITDSILIKVFKETDTQGHFEFKNPQIDFKITNSFGIPIDLHLNNLQTIQAFPGGQHLPLSGFPSPIPITTPLSIGEETTTNLILNNTNTSNLNSIISPTPKYFYYEANALPNPNGNTGVLNFVDENSMLEIDADVNMPLEGYAYGFYVQDTVDFKLDQDVSKVDSIMFRLIADNGFPVDVKAEIIAVDKNYNVIFNVYDPNSNLIEGSPVDANGKATTAVRSVSDIRLTPVQLKKIGDIKKLIIRAETNTIGYDENSPSNSTNVKFFDSYNLAFKLSMNVSLK